VHVNDIKGGPRTAAYMLQYDSVNSRSWKRLRLSYIGMGRVLEMLLVFSSAECGGQVHLQWNRTCLETPDGKGFTVDGKLVTFSESKTIEGVPWKELGCDMVLECTGTFLSSATLKPYLDAGVKKVVVSAPVKEPTVLNVVMGVNDGAPAHLHSWPWAVPRLVRPRLRRSSRGGHSCGAGCGWQRN
jgi:hypothetical protein